MTIPRGVIFGLDEVLIHTDVVHFQAWWVIADRLGIPFTRPESDALRGLTAMQTLDKILALGTTEVSRTEKELLVDEQDLIYRELLRGLSPTDVAPGVLETLTGLRAQGLRLAVGSAHRNARVVLERTGLRDRFDAVSDGENVRRAEPDPEVFLRAADFLALSPDHCVVVVGTAVGVEAAAEGGFTTFGLGAAAAHPRTSRPIDGVSEVLACSVG